VVDGGRLSPAGLSVSRRAFVVSRSGSAFGRHFCDPQRDSW
jgi:hypothetical protein